MLRNLTKQWIIQEPNTITWKLTLENGKMIRYVLYSKTMQDEQKRNDTLTLDCKILIHQSFDLTQHTLDVYK